MKIRRYKRGDCAMDFIESGQWVLYADHAAAMDQVQRDHAAVLDYKLAEAGKELTAVLERLYRAEKERDTLRDEVLAWRAFQEEAEKRSWSKAWYVHAERIADTHDKTDAAGIKGVE